MEERVTHKSPCNLLLAGRWRWQWRALASASPCAAPARRVPFGAFSPSEEEREVIASVVDEKPDRKHDDSVYDELTSVRGTRLLPGGRPRLRIAPQIARSDILL